jgi:hypothetical protein
MSAAGDELDSRDSANLLGDVFVGGVKVSEGGRGLCSTS